MDGQSWPAFLTNRRTSPSLSLLHGTGNKWCLPLCAAKLKGTINLLLYFSCAHSRDYVDAGHICSKPHQSMCLVNDPKPTRLTCKMMTLPRLGPAPNLHVVPAQLQVCNPCCAMVSIWTVNTLKMYLQFNCMMNHDLEWPFTHTIMSTQNSHLIELSNWVVARLTYQRFIWSCKLSPELSIIKMPSQ